MNAEWLAEQIRESQRHGAGSAAVAEMWSLLRERAVGFAGQRPDVQSSVVLVPRRGLQHDESASFLRAVAEGIAEIDDAGSVTLPTVRQKAPVGRYALFSKSGIGVSVNLEYIIQIGATAELILDHGWPPDRVGFEQGEFDAVAYGDLARVVLAMEAKARVTGPDSLEKLIRSWMRFEADPTVDLNSNAGRKWRELALLTRGGPVTVWLVADGARWTLTATTGEQGLSLSPASRSEITATRSHGGSVLTAIPYDGAFHGPATLAASGGCSWHGRTCSGPPEISFEDAHGWRQSGCGRAVRELVARGELTWPPKG